MGEGLPPEEFVRELLEWMPRFLRQMFGLEQDHIARGVLTVPQHWALEHVARRDGCSVGELGKVLRRAPSTLTALTDRLVELKLIRRAPDPVDRRAIRLYPTAAGRRLLADFYRRRAEVARRHFDGLSDRERGQYIRLLRKVVEQTEARGD